MATWITHLMIADRVLERLPGLDRRGFCVGNIAPDCNVENEDWTAFTPPREVTHWMQGERKKASDCDAFCGEYIRNRIESIQSDEEYAFLLGYYAHLLTDAAFQAMIRNEDRVKAVWSRIKADEQLREASGSMEETWDSVKKLVPKRNRMREIYAMEAEYLRDHPKSGYLTEILPLKAFPDYIGYLPQGSIVRKIGVMGYLPNLDDSVEYITMSRQEYAEFVDQTVQLVVAQFLEKRLLRDSQGLYELAMRHIYGNGVPEDNEFAVKLLTQAHGMGHVEATYNLGICYHYGYGTEADLQKTYELYSEAAGAGYGKGMELVGRFYNRGIYVARDRQQAEVWLNKAMQSDDPEAVEEAAKELRIALREERIEETVEK